MFGGGNSCKVIRLLFVLLTHKWSCGSSAPSSVSWFHLLLQNGFLPIDQSNWTYVAKSNISKAVNQSKPSLSMC